MASDLPDAGAAVIVGGGVLGCPSPNSPDKMGWTDIVLLEQQTAQQRDGLAMRRPVGQLRQSIQL